MQHNGNVEKFKKAAKYSFDEYNDKNQHKKKRSKRVKRVVEEF